MASYVDEQISHKSFVKEYFDGVLFEDCEFEQCDFSESEFNNCIFRDCVFEECNWSQVAIYNAKIQGISFQNCRIRSVNFGASGPGPSRFQFKECEIDYAIFEEMDLPDFVMEDCQLKECTIAQCELVKASFKASTFNDCLVESNNLTQSDFREAKAYRFSPFDNVIRKAKFSLPDAAVFLPYLDIEVE